jgi:hypothetical protein
MQTMRCADGVRAKAGAAADLFEPDREPMMRLTTIAIASVLAAVAAPALAQDIGVASCDQFLKTYTACVTAKVPAEQRANVTSALDKTKANWISVASTPEGKSKLDATCKETAEKMKKEVAALNCAW